MAGTKKFISASVGVGGTNMWADVRSVQQLLIAAGVPVPGGDDGRWGGNTLTALQTFGRSQVPSVAPTLLQPGDDFLFNLAKKAEILIPLPVSRGLGGIDSLHSWFVRNNIGYQPGAENGGGNRCVYGLDGRTDYALQTVDKGFRKGPVQMDCTTYANLMLSVYMHGNAHNVQYDGDCQKIGGLNSFHCARDRYGFPIVNRKDKDKSGNDVTVTDFRTADQILVATREKGPGLYALEPATLGTGSVKHLALLFGTDVYECSNATAPNCIKHSLTEFMDRCRSNGRFCYLFGPK
jgi:hypothetical protein